MLLGKNVLLPNRKFRSASLNVRSTSLNLRSTSLNVGSTSLNETFKAYERNFLLGLETIINRNNINNYKERKQYGKVQVAGIA